MSDILARLATALEVRYRVIREIGAGGMATVYLAHDLRHERDVAIKVLHPELAAALGAERFLAEIKTTAKLQHPHILPLLDSGEAGGLLYYVMPYVSGESLRTRLDRETQLPVDDAVRIAREVASALESAHRQGVVHRDIKPENILLHEEQALVADFGIALAVSAAGGPRMTQTGLSLGTPAYMSPEQAMGERAIDARSDIYAVGAVLYEMLVGEAPFTGPSVQAIVARVMTEQPRNISTQRRSVPEHLNSAVLKALEKLPADRFHTAAEMSAALLAVGSGVSRAADESMEHAPARRRPYGLRDILPWSIAGLAVIIAGASLIRRAVNAGDQPLSMFSIGLAPGMSLDKTTANLDFSADGRTLAFSAVSDGVRQIFLRDLSSDSLRVVPGTNGTTGSTEISPDGKWIAFNSNEVLAKAPLAGGTPVVLGQSRWAHIAWLGNESLIYTRSYNTGLYRVSAEGKDTTAITTPDRAKGELGHWWPQLLPDGDHILFTNYTTPADKSVIEIVSLRDKSRKVVLENGYYARYASGRLLFVRGQSVMTVPLDLDGMRLQGTPTPLPLRIAINPTNGWAGFATTESGILAYMSDPNAPVEMLFADEGGAEEKLSAEAGNYLEAAVSPDARKIALVRDGDVWVLDRTRRLFTRLTRSEQTESSLVWSHDSRAVFYQRDVPQFDIFRRAADAGSAEERILTSSDDKAPTSVTPDGSMLFFEDDSDADAVGILPLTGPRAGQPQILIDAPGNQRAAHISPDGMWLIYESDESGRQEIYLVAYPLNRATARQQVSINGGFNPVWGPDGRTVYYNSARQVIRVRVNPRTGDIGQPEILDKLPARDFWSIAPDGRFLLGGKQQNAERPAIKIVMNWPALIDAEK